MVHASPSVLKQAELLKSAPFVFPFIERVRFFTSLVVQDRSLSQGRHQEFLMGPSISFSVRRSHIYEDAFAELAQGQGVCVWVCVNCVMCVCVGVGGCVNFVCG